MVGGCRLRDVCAIHASPPCQRWAQVTLSQRRNGKEYPDLIAPTRTLLEASGLPWVIENVPDTPLRPDIRLCGCQFGLTLPGVGYLKRERWFETSWRGFHLEMPHRHTGHAISIAGHGTPAWMRAKTGHIGVAEWRRVMGIDWTTRDELTEAIPPAYTEYVGIRLLVRGTACRLGSDGRDRMMPPAAVLPDWDTEKSNAVAVALLFTTPPSDRALAGWNGAAEACEELTMLGVHDPMAGAA